MQDEDLSQRELRRQAIQQKLDAERSSSERNRLGQFATPNVLAKEITEYVGTLVPEAWNGVRFADPAIGTGSFYSATLAVFGSSQIESALGIECDSRLCRAARDIWGSFGLEVICGDFTKIVAQGMKKPNLILTNPPYVRHHHINRAEKERLQILVHRATGTKVSGLAGLYVYFVLLATSWLEHNGLAAWLIPSEFMDVNYGKTLKSFLTDQLTLIRAHRFDPSDGQFEDALVSSAVLVFRKEAPSPVHEVEFTLGGSLASPHSTDRIPIKELQQVRKWTGYPRNHKNDRIAPAPGGMTLGDLFRIQRGVATGNNQFFVLPRIVAEQRGISAMHLRPILPSPRKLKADVIEADETGFPCLDSQLCLIDCDLPEAVLKQRCLPLWEYLESGKALGVDDTYLTGKRRPWYRQERREPAPFLCTYMGRGADEKRPFRFVWNQSRAIATNLYLMLYPRGALASMLRRQPGRASEVFRLLSELTGRQLRSEGRVYGGGLNKIEPRELARVSGASFLRRWPELGSELPVELKLQSQ